MYYSIVREFRFKEQEVTCVHIEIPGGRKMPLLNCCYINREYILKFWILILFMFFNGRNMRIVDCSKGCDAWVRRTSINLYESEYVVTTTTWRVSFFLAARVNLSQILGYLSFHSCKDNHTKPLFPTLWGIFTIS